MRRLIILFTLTILPAVANAAVTVRVCEADGNTLFDDRDIMVGTKLTIIVSSDNADLWAGDIAILGDLQNYGVLSGRDFNEVTWDWEGSHFPEAGDDALVVEWTEEGILGFNFSNGFNAVADQDWFIVDYTATAVGDCNVAFYDFSMEPSYFLPSTGAFHHVPTRDFNQNTIVDFPDFAILASYWQQSCSDPEWCEGADLNTNGDVNTVDLGLFCDYWLEKTE